MTREITLREYADERERSYNALRTMKLPGFIRRDRRGKIFDMAVLDEFFDQMDAMDDAANAAESFGFEWHYRSESEDQLAAINKVFLRRLHEEALAAFREREGVSYA